MKFARFPVYGIWSYSKSRKSRKLFNSYIVASIILSYYEIIIFTNIRIQRKQLFWDILRRYSFNLCSTFALFSPMCKKTFISFHPNHFFFFFFCDITRGINCERNMTVNNPIPLTVSNNLPEIMIFETSYLIPNLLVKAI